MKATDLLAPPEIALLRRRSDLVGALLVLHAWALIGAAMALFARWPNPGTFLVAVVVVGGRQLGLAVLMHDAAHGLLFRRRWLNERIGQWLCAWPILSDMAAYRPYHILHHRRTQEEDDPDRPLSAPFPVTRQSLRRKIVRDLTGRTGLRLRMLQLREALGPPGAGAASRGAYFFRMLGGALAVNLALLVGLAALGRAYLFPLLWLVPMLTWYQLIVRVRNIAEHAMVPDDADPLRNTRTTHAGLLARLFFAPYWVNYHLEHHLFLFVPCFRLREAHRLLRQKGYAPKMELQPSYRAVLRLAASATEERPRVEPPNGRQFI